MKFKNTFTSIVLCTLLSTVTFAHEGHDHDAPSTFQPKKGGIVKSTESINVEAVTKDNSVELYFFDNEGNIKPKDSFEVSAESQLPKTKKKSKVNLEEVKNAEQFSHYAITGGPKKVHRYSLILKIKDKHEDHSDRITFNIEPKK